MMTSSDHLGKKLYISSFTSNNNIGFAEVPINVDKCDEIIEKYKKENIKLTYTHFAIKSLA